MKASPARAAHPAGDAEILAQIVAGNLDALGVLYDRYERDVRRLVQRLGVASHDADDVVQTVFLEALRAAPGFDGRASARAWILGVAAMHVRRYRRSIARAFRVVADFVSGASGAHTEHETPADALDATRTRERLAETLARLSPKKREVFLLVTAEGLSAEQVAVALGIPIATVWTRLHYARQEIRQHLAHLEGEVR